MPNVYFLLPCLSLILGYLGGRYRRRIAENSGEAKIRQSLVNYCVDKDAHILSNITLRLEDGSTTQIDHILISTKGIFVIEAKHYKGLIIADTKSKFWTQVIHNKEYNFQNPVFQNYKHVVAVQNLFEFLAPEFIYNIVVFTGEARFKTTTPENVYYIKKLIPAIDDYSQGVLSLNRVQFCIGRLEYIRLELTKKTDIEHKAYLIKKFGR